jgi:hypothetical protein
LATKRLSLFLRYIYKNAMMNKEGKINEIIAQYLKRPKFKPNEIKAAIEKQLNIKIDKAALKNRIKSLKLH